MPSPILTDSVLRISGLVGEIEAFAPTHNINATRFRAELAGLLAVFVVAQYETCVKETLISFASQYGREFEGYIERNHTKLNSKITCNDLRRYANTLDPSLGAAFKNKLDRRRKLFSRICGSNIEKSLDTLLQWRHEYAHAGVLVTTIEEVLRTHRLARLPIVTFEEVFSAH